ncbi:PaaI family thioesterase [Desulfosporosinus sp. BICA1-9]|uniref:PaaI family thioesterase n=1 Tax=Desulfosporosinus sp. BICA1-9 TaxID=1531958 RepID=UPI00054B44FD|nr:PaaI family thioesterase [Desulfosporosinus sp. BICA1-9]KJS47067.1 MAG: thioesterase [Peptococcaceae bacterium BRH_c23]KJS79512.1 MAG: thioesterase [Desulfosporosinus sp. BICA1-9]HBW38244.1 PaaI family thioesterase [Desulfosporosinus sp.]
MKYTVMKRQQNSKKCIVCGLENDLGLKASFYELENGELVAIFKPLEEHQSYPERLHGGIAGTILDETIGRAIMVKEEDIWGVTVELNIKYRKPIPLTEELRVIGRITKNSSRLFEGTGEIFLKNGAVAVSAWGKYLKMPIDKIANFNEDDQEWQVIFSEGEPNEIDI